MCINILKRMETFTNAMVFASVKHQHQKRKQAGGIPYINHPIEVANILVQSGVKDYDVLAAALLHDTIEDTDATEEEVKGEFGPLITALVMECSDNKELSKVQRKKVQIEKAMKTSHPARLVKLADKISNNRCLLTNSPEGWTESKKQGYFIWSQMVCENLKGGNKVLDKTAEEVFEKSGINELSEEEKGKFLDAYYEELGKEKA